MVWAALADGKEYGFQESRVGRSVFDSLIGCNPALSKGRCVFPYDFKKPHGAGQREINDSDTVPLRNWATFCLVVVLGEKRFELWAWVVMDDSFSYRRPPQPRVEEFQIREVDSPEPGFSRPLRPSPAPICHAAEQIPRSGGTMPVNGKQPRASRAAPEPRASQTRVEVATLHQGEVVKDPI